MQGARSEEAQQECKYRCQPMTARCVAHPGDPCAADRCRHVVVGGKEMQVPRHVVRVDGERCCGWQVRLDSPSRYFGDAAFGGAEGSLDAACDYLKAIYRPEPKTTWRGCSRRGKREVGISVQRNGKGHWYVVAHHPVERASPRKYYVGTDETRSRARELVARRRARQQRMDWLANLPVPLR